jgi:crotonobetainyl-CoA:carnitine CoA-transferase CaiB-like acyl-CoA transferase
MSELGGLEGSLAGIRVLDFSALLPGPMASLIFAACGAHVIKVERTPEGDDMRGYQPALGGAAVDFLMLNRAKESIAVDLKDPEVRARILEMIPSVDIVLEQFRPGVMDRLGLGPAALMERNPRLVYCALRGYGPGPDGSRAGHDLTYLADAGLLALGETIAGRPPVPPVLIADIAAGTLPVVMNVALALLQRQRTQKGAVLELSIVDNLGLFTHRALAHLFASLPEPKAGSDFLTGAAPRYRTYLTRDGGVIAVAALEPKFWDLFCDCVGVDPAATVEDVAAAIGARDLSYWTKVFDENDCCARPVRSVGEARGGASLRGADPVLPLPIADALKRDAALQPAPRVGEHNAKYGLPAPRRNAASTNPDAA